MRKYSSPLGGLRSAGLYALQYIYENPGINTLMLDRARRTARGGHQWMYRTVDRLRARGLVTAGKPASGRGVGLYTTPLAEGCLHG